MKNGIFKKISFLAVCFLTTFTYAQENFAPSPFQPAPAAANGNSINNSNMNEALYNERQPINAIQNQIRQGANQGLNNVTKALTEKELRTQKILESINGKMANAKNIPIENSRFIGVINGKRVYQNLETNEYVKVEVEK